FGESKDALLLWDAFHARRIVGGEHYDKAPIECRANGIAAGRNSLARLALERGVEWLFMVDADMGFMPDALDRLVAAADPVERPVIGGLCFAQRFAAAVGEMFVPTYVAIPTIYDWVDS